jgi:hypothetical protein
VPPYCVKPTSDIDQERHWIIKNDHIDLHPILTLLMMLLTCLDNIKLTNSIDQNAAVFAQKSVSGLPHNI